MHLILSISKKEKKTERKKLSSISSSKCMTCFWLLKSDTSHIRSDPSSEEVKIVSFVFGCHSPQVNPEICPLVFFRSRMYMSPFINSPNVSPSRSYIWSKDGQKGHDSWIWCVQTKMPKHQANFFWLYSSQNTLACAEPVTHRNLSAVGLQLKLRTWCPSNGSSCLNDANREFIPWKSYMWTV